MGGCSRILASAKEGLTVDDHNSTPRPCHHHRKSREKTPGKAQMSRQSQRDWKRGMFKRERDDGLERTHNTRTERDGKECAVFRKKYMEVREMSRGVIEMSF